LTVDKTITIDDGNYTNLQSIYYRLNFSNPKDSRHHGLYVDTQTVAGSTNNNSNSILSSWAVARHYATDVLKWAVGFEGFAVNQSTGTIANASANTAFIQNVGGGTINNAHLFYGQMEGNLVGGTINNLYGISLKAPLNSGTIKNQYGIYIDNLNQATDNNWAIYSAGGNSSHHGALTLGSNNPPATSAILDLNTTTGALLLPRLTTEQRNNLTPANGMIIYNLTTKTIQGYTNGVWRDL
jgi:hypothetical protein